MCEGKRHRVQSWWHTWGIQIGGYAPEHLIGTLKRGMLDSSNPYPEYRVCDGCYGFEVWYGDDADILRFYREVRGPSSAADESNSEQVEYGVPSFEESLREELCAMPG